MLDLFNFNIGGSPLGRGQGHGVGGQVFTGSVPGVSKASIRRPGVTECQKMAKKILTILDRASIDVEELSEELWNLSDDATKANVYTLVNALLNEGNRREISGETFTEVERQIGEGCRAMDERNSEWQF